MIGPFQGEGGGRAAGPPQEKVVLTRSVRRLSHAASLRWHSKPSGGTVGMRPEMLVGSAPRIRLYWERHIRVLGTHRSIPGVSARPLAHEVRHAQRPCDKRWIWRAPDALDPDCSTAGGPFKRQCASRCGPILVRHSPLGAAHVMLESDYLTRQLTIPVPGIHVASADRVLRTNCRATILESQTKTGRGLVARLRREERKQIWR